MSGGASWPCLRQGGMLAALLSVVLLSATSQANGEEPVAASTTPHPFGECRVGTWSGTRNLDDDGARVKATCLAQWRLPLNERVRASLGARAGVADAPNRAAGSIANSATLRASNTTARLREGYVELEQGLVRVRAGRQIIAWGRADRINPTDNLSPRDFTFLSQEDEEQRNGLGAIAVDAKSGGAWSVSGVYVPRFEPHVVPAGLLPRGVTRVARPVKPEVALKLEHAGAEIDFSLSYYRGFDRFLRYGLATPVQSGAVLPTVSSSPPVVRASFNRQQTFGADIAFNVGKYAIRAELATSRYSPVDASLTESPASTRTIDRAVVGIDRTVFDTANLNLQVFSIHRRGYTDTRALDQPANIERLSDGLARLNSEYGRGETGATLRISDRFLNDKMRLELGAIYDFSQRSYLLRPRSIYSFSDSIRVSAGADYFHGREQSFFGARVKNSLAYVELVWIF
jgi:hypothetical protein